jgi:hypothetical protein
MILRQEPTVPFLAPVISRTRQARITAGVMRAFLCAILLQSGSTFAAGPDLDGDELDDSVEQELAEQFAPVIYHAPDEPNMPTNVQSFLSMARLYLHDVTCEPPVDKLVVSGPTRIDLLSQTIKPCAWAERLDSRHAWDDERRRTYYLGDLDRSARAGSADSREWTTYFHAYPNDIGGITVQYWRFYAFNSGSFMTIGSHGGDWEGIHVVLNREHKAIKVRLLGHWFITEVDRQTIEWHGDHPVVYGDRGGHSTRCGGSKDGIRQETWTRGKVTGPRRGRDEDVTGELTNLGEKLHPMPEQDFLRYSGLWGSPGIITSGYWGPAFNETGMGAHHFVSAWCHDRRNKLDSTDDGSEFECFPHPPSLAATEYYRPHR